MEVSNVLNYRLTTKMAVQSLGTRLGRLYIINHHHNSLNIVSTYCVSSLRVNYDFLAKICGISGASGW